MQLLIKCPRNLQQAPTQNASKSLWRKQNVILRKFLELIWIVDNFIQVVHGLFCLITKVLPLEQLIIKCPLNFKANVNAKWKQVTIVKYEIEKISRFDLYW